MRLHVRGQRRPLANDSTPSLSGTLDAVAPTVTVTLLLDKATPSGRDRDRYAEITLSAKEAAELAAWSAHVILDGGLGDRRSPAQLLRAWAAHIDTADPAR